MLSTLTNAHILIVDDEPDIADILKTAFTREGFSNISICHTAKDALEMFNTTAPDIVLLDIMLPDQSGHDLIQLFKHTHPVPVLFVSAKGEEVDRLFGFALGADDYITKPFSPREVVYRVKARLKQAPTSDVLSFGDIVVNRTNGEITKSGSQLEFTAKEYKLLNYFIDHPNRILTKEMITSNVWGESFDGFDNTISVHIRRIRKKIEDDPSAPVWIQTVIGMGYRFNK